jgi:hypothetical protein
MIWVGGSYRERSSSSVLFGCNIKKLVTLGYSYDFTLTQLNSYSSGSHEIMISYLFPFKKKKTASEMVKEADELELNTIDNSMKTNLKNKKKAEKKEKEEKKEQEKKLKETENEKQPDGEKKEDPSQEIIDEKIPDDVK